MQPTAYDNQPLEIAAGSISFIPFSFELPLVVPYPESVAGQISRLPPSLEAGKTSVGSCGRVCGQPRIDYAIRFSATAQGPTTWHRIEVQRSRNFVVIPITAPEPPIDEVDFPGEFKLVSSAALQRRLFPHRIGVAQLSIKEPEPLRLSKHCNPSGKAWVKLTYQPLRHALPFEERLECILDSQIEIKTFYSTVPLREMASKQALQTNRHLHLHSKTISLKAWKTITHFGTSGKTHSNNDWEDDAECEGSCELLLPINLVGDLVHIPTFCSPFAARRYALKVALKIQGRSHAPIMVAVPLQFYYNDTTAAPLQVHRLGFDSAPSFAFSRSDQSTRRYYNDDVSP